MVTIQLAHTFTSDGEANVFCGDSLSQPGAWVDATITAIEATTATKVPLADET